jgi:hypothetical protein
VENKYGSLRELILIAGLGLGVATITKQKRP